MTTSTPTGKVLYATHEGVHMLRFLGEIRHPMGPALERFLEGLLEKRPTSLVFDLSETHIIDSTCLGLLARAALQLRAWNLEPATVVSPIADITEVLRSMSFDRLFRIVGDVPLKPTGERMLATSCEEEAGNPLATMLGAHRALMELSELNRLEFKDVVEALERESEVHR